MVEKIIKISTIARLTIEQALEEFMTVQRKELKPKTVSDFEDVLQFLRDYMNNYAYQGLTHAEAAFFEKHFNAKGKERRGFCQLFGPEKIVDELGGFLGDFMVRKVMAGGDFKRLAGTVTKKLSKWLAEKGYISEKDARQGEEEGAAAADDLPKAEKAANILYRAAEKVVYNQDKLDDDDYYEFDHYTIEKVEPGNLWFEVYDQKGSSTIGPIAVPKEATKLCQKGWDISCAMARIKGQWKIVEVANVYPN